MEHAVRAGRERREESGEEDVGLRCRVDGRDDGGEHGGAPEEAEQREPGRGSPVGDQGA
jgi:hypothetical protein